MRWLRRKWRLYQLRRESLRTVFVVEGIWGSGDMVLRNTRTGENLYVPPFIPTERDQFSDMTTMLVTRGIGSVQATKMMKGDPILLVQQGVSQSAAISLLKTGDHQVGQVLVPPVRVKS